MYASNYLYINWNDWDIKCIGILIWESIRQFNFYQMYQYCISVSIHTSVVDWFSPADLVQKLVTLKLSLGEDMNLSYLFRCVIVMDLCVPPPIQRLQVIGTSFPWPRNKKWLKKWTHGSVDSVCTVCAEGVSHHLEPNEVQLLHNLRSTKVS